MRTAPISEGELDVHVAAERGAEWLRGGFGYYRAVNRLLLAFLGGPDRDA